MIELFEVVPIELTEVSFTERCSKSTISFRYITDEEAKVHRTLTFFLQINSLKVLKSRLIFLSNIFSFFLVVSCCL